MGVNGREAEMADFDFVNSAARARAIRSLLGMAIFNRKKFRVFNLGMILGIPPLPPGLLQSWG